MQQSCDLDVRQSQYLSEGAEARSSNSDPALTKHVVTKRVVTKHVVTVHGTWNVTTREACNGTQVEIGEQRRFTNMATVWRAGRKQRTCGARLRNGCVTAA